jgi:hypothetical protein
MASTAPESVKLVQSSSEYFAKGEILYVTCVSDTSEKYKIFSFPALELFLREMHFSFPAKLHERRLCLLLDGPASRDLGHLSAPTWIEVLSSCHFKVNIYQPIIMILYI